MAGQLRIIGGEWRGRRLAVGGAPGLRPTGDRTRETLFNWLQGLVPGARVLDCFAGTGALGLEALSRGAAKAVFIERSRRVANPLRAHIATLEADSRARVVVADALRYGGLQDGPFDIVFVDPPFRLGLQAPMLERLAEPGWLTARGVVYVECDARTGFPPVPAGWIIHRERTAGGVCFGLTGPDASRL